MKGREEECGRREGGEGRREWDVIGKYSLISEGGKRLRGVRGHGGRGGGRQGRGETGKGGGRGRGEADRQSVVGT